MSGGLRRDVQGLRALAVLLVVADHAGWRGLPGGFVGVDVFFVVSGFLITGLLLREVDDTGRFSLARFYARRARRILPAATVVMLATVLATVWLSSAVQAQAATRDAWWALLFLANVKFARDGNDYFQTEAATSPLQHYWSLAVEEQFYLVWPLLLLAVIGALVLLRRPDRRRALRRALVPVLVLVVVASYVWSIVSTGRDPVTAYYSPLTRAGELGFGALVAVSAERFTGVTGAGRRVLTALGWVGAGGVLVAAVLVEGESGFPGAIVALPVVATGLVIAAGCGSEHGVSRALGVRPLGWLGDRSYSLYLWHWPALVLARGLWGPLAWWQTVLVLGAALGLTMATYRLVEQPFRTGRLGRRGLRGVRGLVLYPTAVLVALPTLSVAHTITERQAEHTGPPLTVQDVVARYGTPHGPLSPRPREALVEASVIAADASAPIPADLSPGVLDLPDDQPEDAGDCNYYRHNIHRKLCAKGDLDGDRTLVLTGDSHAAQWIPALTTLAERYGYRAYFLTRVGCTAADALPWSHSGDGPAIPCAQFRAWVRGQVERLHPDLTLVASAASRSGWVTEQGERITDPQGVAAVFRDGMTRTLQGLRPLTDRLVVIGDPPAVQIEPGRCLSTRDATLADCSVPPGPRMAWLARNVAAAARETGVRYVETDRWFCAYGRCPAVVGGYIVRRDSNHVSSPYAHHLALPLGRAIGLVSQVTPD